MQGAPHPSSIAPSQPPEPILQQLGAALAWHKWWWCQFEGDTHGWTGSAAAQDPLRTYTSKQKAQDVPLTPLQLQDHTTAPELWQSLGMRPWKEQTCRAEAVLSNAARSQPSLIKLPSFQQAAAHPGKQRPKTNTPPTTSGCKRLQAPKVKFSHWQQCC